jgi:hypothetical protein
MNQSIHQMQRYVLGGVAIMVGAAVSFPIAMARVSATPKFAGQAVISQTCEGRNPTPHQVVSWLDTCRHMQVNSPPAPPK